MAERKPIKKPKTPLPPPPKPKRIFTETGEEYYLIPNPVYNTPIGGGQGAQSEELPVRTPPSQGLQTGQSLQTQSKQNKAAERTSPISRAYPKTQGPPLPPRNPVASKSPPGECLPKSPVAESTPKKGIIRNVYARAREFFTRNSTTPYENLHQPPSPGASATTPKKRGIFRRLWGGSTTPNRRQNDTLSDTATSPASPDRSYSGYSGDLETSGLNDSSLSSSSDHRRGPQSPDISSDISACYFPEAAGTRSGASIQGLRSADTSSDMSSSDLDDDDRVYARVQKQDSKSLSIQVNAPANISVTTSDKGDVTACIETASYRKKDEWRR